MTEVLTPDAESISRAAEIIKEGGTVIYPTETAYALGCDATNRDAIEKIYDIKKRPREKKLTVIVSGIDMAERYCNLSEEERKVCENLMPGPLTLIAEKKEGSFPASLNSHFVFRIPGSETAREISRKVGVPVVATSANISGEVPRYSLENIDEEVREGADLMIDGGELEPEEPSTIINITAEGPVFHRKGPIKPGDVERVISE